MTDLNVRLGEITKEEKRMNHATGNKTGLSKQPAKSSPRREPAEEEIRFRAYEIYVSRNGKPGRELDDWLQAERELQSRN